MSALQRLFERARREIPPVLDGWEGQVDSWCDDYTAAFPQASVSEINLDVAAFMFDHGCERVILAYALSVEQLMARDTNRMKGFPNVNISVRRVLGEKAFPADRGHFLGHASGGILDINLFPQRRDLNRGWSPAGKRFRSMERYVAEHPGSFFYHRPLYDDTTWIPHSLEYGVLIEASKWWVETFRNK
jgi:hypothetical protein